MTAMAVGFIERNKEVGLMIDASDQGRASEGAPAGAAPLAPSAGDWREIARQLVVALQATGPWHAGCGCNHGSRGERSAAATCLIDVALRNYAAALSSPPSAPAASGAPPHDAAEELTCLREMYQDALRDMDEMLTDFASALGLPDPIRGTESPGYPHILRAINVLKARVTMGDGGACSLCGAARVYRENRWLCSNPECPASVVTALSPQASAPEGPAAGTTEEE